MIGLLLSLSIPQAEAFCGTYVGGVGSEFFNEYSQLAVYREGASTTLTVSNDIQGSFDSFAMVMPIPPVVLQYVEGNPEASDIRVLEPEVFDRLDQYSEPRLVSYVCEDFAAEEDFGSSPNSEDGGVGGGAGGVVVEAEYIVGEYQIVVLSATESEALFSWLNDEDFLLPQKAVDLLQEYIDRGNYFIAAKVHSDAGVQSGDILSPLQLRYESEAFQIPIRIGTLNSKSEQDLVIYALNSYAEGAVGISNYPEFTVEDECLWNSEGEDFGSYYSRLFTEGYQTTDEAAWIIEYAWGGGNCDPCSGAPPEASDMVALGLNENDVHNGNYFLTRLHARYTPDQVDEELMLYQSGITEQSQIRFIQYETYLEDRFPICGEGMVENPGSCDSIGDAEVKDSAGSIDGCGGCSASGGALGGLWSMAMAFGLGWRRRKQ